jgi:hypothetical protein
LTCPLHALKYEIFRFHWFDIVEKKNYKISVFLIMNFWGVPPQTRVKLIGFVRNHIDSKFYWKLHINLGFKKTHSLSDRSRPTILNNGPIKNMLLREKKLFHQINWVNFVIVKKKNCVTYPQVDFHYQFCIGTPESF